MVAKPSRYVLKSYDYSTNDELRQFDINECCNVVNLVTIISQECIYGFILFDTRMLCRLQSSVRQLLPPSPPLTLHGA